MPKLTVSMIKSKMQDLDSEVQFLIQKARMLKAEKERAKRKAEAEEKKAEEERLKKEKKAKKKKAKEANATESEGDVPSTDSPEELLELVPGLVWAVLRPGGEAPTQPENLRLPTRPPRHKHKEPSPSFLETMLILVVIHFLFEYCR